MIKVLWKIVPKEEHPGETLFKIKNAIKADPIFLNKYKAELHKMVQAYAPIKYIEQELHPQFYTINEVFMGMPMRTTIARDFMNNENKIRIDCVFEVVDKQCSA